MNTNKASFLYFRLVFLVCMLFFTENTSTFGQKVIWSVPQRVSDRAYITESLGENAGIVYVLKKNNRLQNHDVTLERYGADMRTVTTKVLCNKRTDFFIKAILDSAGIRIFYAKTDKDKKQTNIRLKNFSFDLAEDGQDTTLFTISGTEPEEALITAYKVKMSPLVFFTYTNDKGDFATNYDYVLLDRDYRKISNGVVNLASGVKSAIEQVSFDESHLGILVREDVKNSVNSKGYQFYLYNGRFGEPEMRRTNLYSDTFFVTEGILKTDFKNQNMVFAGLYATKDSVYVKGSFVWKSDFKTKKESFIYKPFTPDVLVNMSGRKSRLQGIFNLRASDMVLRGDGGLILIAEEYQETHESVSDVNAYGVVQPNVRNFFYYQNLLVLSINPIGSVDWHTVIRKDQVTVNDNGTYSSYIMCAMPDKLVFVYNDLSRKNWTLNVAEIDEKGSLNNSILVRPQNYDGRMVPQYGDQITYNGFLVPGITARGIVLMKVFYP